MDEQGGRLCPESVERDPYEKFADTRLRDVDKQVFEAYQDKLPEAWLKRAHHYYTEVERVRTGVEAWRAEDKDRSGGPSLRAAGAALRTTKRARLS